MNNYRNQLRFEDNLHQVMEDYISEGITNNGIEFNEYARRLRNLRFDQTQINVILNDLEDALEKERTARIQEGNARILILCGSVVTLTAITTLALSILGILHSGYINHILIGGAVAALLTILKGNNILRDRQRRRAIRQVLWKDRFV